MIRTRVAYISTAVDFGGSDKVSLTFLKQVDRTGFDIHPVCLIRPWEKDNAFLQELEKSYSVFTLPVARKPRSEGRDPLRVVRCSRLLYRFLRAGAFELVHTHGYFADMIGIPASRILGIPHVSTCHGFIESEAKVRIYNLLDRAALRFADRIIAVSAQIRNELVDKGIRSSRVVTIPNAVNGDWSDEQFSRDRREKRGLLRLEAGEFVAGYAGRLSREKGLLSLIRAGGLLRRSGIPVVIVLFGEGPQRSELQELAASEGMDQAVLFAGFVKDVEHWLPALDVFVLPSLTEGTPMALLEAMACGIPAVASAVGGVPQLIEPGRTGLLVPPGSPEAIADAVRRLYAETGLRTGIAAEARRQVRSSHGVRDWAKKIEAEYLHLLEQKKK